MSTTQSLELVNHNVQGLDPFVDVVGEQFVVLLSCIAHFFLIHLNQDVSLVRTWNFNLVFGRFQNPGILGQLYLSLWPVIFVIPEITLFVELEVS